MREGIEIAPEGSLDWRIEFAEVFAGGGFDIAIANPPYVRMEVQPAAMKRALARSYADVHAPRSDYLVYFFARAVQLLGNGGLLAFITSNTFMSRRYGSKLREYLAGHLTIRTMIDFGELRVFGATVETLVLVGQNKPPMPEHMVRGHNLYPLLARAIGRGANGERVREQLSRLPAHLATEVSIFPQSRLETSEWRIEDEAINQLFERLMNQGTPLGEFVDDRIYMGVKTGRNEAFVIDQAQHDALVEADPRSAEVIRPWLRGRDIDQWRTNWASRYVIFMSRGVDIGQYPAIEEHLRQFQGDLEKRATADSHPWYELQQPQGGIFSEFAQPKIVWPDISRELRFAFDGTGSYIGNTVYAMPMGEPWLLASLNAEMTEFLLCQITNSLRGGFLRAFYQHVTRLPIVIPDSGLKRRLGEIAQAGIAGSAVDTGELNDLVYDLYGLPSSDVTLVRDWFERRSSRS